MELLFSRIKENPKRKHLDSSVRGSFENTH